MATTQTKTEFTYTVITYIGCRGLKGLSKTAFKVFKSQCPVRATVFIEGFEDAGYPIDPLHNATAEQGTEATPKPSTNRFAKLNLVKKKVKSVETPPMIFFSKPTTNVEIRLYVTDKDGEKLLAQTKVPLGSLDGDVKVSRTSPESLSSLREDPIMTFKRTTHTEFDPKLTSIDDLPPINSIFLTTFANVKRFIGVGKALSELATPGKVIIGLVEVIASECDGYVKRRESVTGLLQAVGDACTLVADWDNREHDPHRPNQIKVYQYVFPAVYQCLYFVASLSPTKLAANQHDLEGEIKKLQGQLGRVMERLKHSQNLDIQEMLCDILHIATKIEDKLFLDSLTHDAGLDPSKSCTDGTREAILTHIQKWVILPGDRRVLLLYGVAGKGKSAIIHTISRALGTIDQRQLSLANVSFFAFNRSVANRSIDKLVLTWAWGLASRDPHYLRYLRTLDMEHVKGSPLSNQVKVLLIDGLKRADSRRPIVFVIDALDECPELRPLLKLLDKIFSSPSDLPQHCRFLLTCRPNADILAKLDRPSLIGRISLDDEQWLTVADIRIFVQEKLADWPDVANLVNCVTEAAEGLFQCAALLCNELTTGLEVHRKRFIRKLEVGDFNTLYGTYKQVLEEYIDPQDDLQLKAFKHLMASIFLVRSPQHRDTLLPLAAATLSHERQSASEPCGQWLALESGKELSALESILPLLGSLLSGSTFNDTKVPVLPLHTSFRDYLVEPGEVPGEGEVKVPKGHDFLVDIGPRHQELLALACLDITNAQLRFNMCGFDTSYMLNSEIKGFRGLAEKLDPELKYACQCAVYHLDKSLGLFDKGAMPTDSQKSRAEALNCLRVALLFFLKNRFLYWLEVHSCMESQQDGPGGMLPRFQTWASLHSPGELVSILVDFIKFEKRFRKGYMLSAPQSGNFTKINFASP
ncbi:NACHT domain-containing protein [Pleurotus pulmonarius]